MTTGRSIAAVAAGLVLLVAASIGTDVILQRTVMPDINSRSAGTHLLVTALIYRTLYGVAGAWVAAKLAPGRPMIHALVLGAIVAAVDAFGVAATWRFGQHWYPITLALLALPQSWLGGAAAVARAKGLPAR